MDFAAPRGVFSVARRFDPELEGDKPAELVVQRPAKFALAGNLQTARALSLQSRLSMYGVRTSSSQHTAKSEGDILENRII